MRVLEIFGIWFAVSAVVSLLIGSFFRAGEEETEGQSISKERKMKIKAQAAVLVALFCVAGLFTAAQKQKKQEQKSTDRPVAAATATSIVLTWQQAAPTCTPTPCPLTGNQIFRGVAPGGEQGTPIFTSSTPITTYTDTAGLVQGTTYYYQVTAGNVNGFSAKSAEANVTFGTPVNVPPNAPTALSGVAQ